MVSDPPLKYSVSHSRDEETPEAKARWFQSLTVEQRMEILCEYTELILSIQPDIAEKKDAPKAHGRVCVLKRK